MKSAPPRILMLLQNSPYSEDGRVRREARALRDAGYQVMVICPRAKGEPRRMKLDDVELYQFTQCTLGSGFLGYGLEYAWAMAMVALWSLWVALTRGFDVAHAHNPPDFFVLHGRFWKLCGKKYVFDQHDLAPEMFAARFGEGHPIVKGILTFFERLSCQWADQVIATNESYQKWQIDQYGIPPERTTIVRNGPEAFHFAPVEPHPALQKMSGTIIGYVGEMGPQDGVDYLIRSLSHLKTSLGRDDWHAVIVGEGDEVSELKQLAAELAIANKVYFTGRVAFEEVVPYLAGMDICTAPDPANGYNDRSTLIKIMEYMAQGKPTVAFDLTETRYSAGDSGVYVPCNDEAAFAQTLADLMDDPARRTALGAVGRRRAEEVLAWRHAAENLLTLYHKLFRSREEFPRAADLLLPPSAPVKPHYEPHHDHCNV